jgi:gliding motility-associated lipoprotein GldH
MNGFKFLVSSLFAAAMLCFAGCDDSHVFEQSQLIENANWNVNQPVNFEFDIQDTVSFHNFYVTLRNQESYAYSNIFLFVSLEFPNGKLSIDTINCPLADTEGHWLGSGLGDLYDNRIIFKERKKFPMAGHYRISIQQAMRTENLEGIADVGFRLSKLQ